ENPHNAEWASCHLGFENCGGGRDADIARVIVGARPVQLSPARATESIFFHPDFCRSVWSRVIVPCGGPDIVRVFRRADATSLAHSFVVFDSVYILNSGHVYHWPDWSAPGAFDACCPIRNCLDRHGRYWYFLLTSQLSRTRHGG